MRLVSLEVANFRGIRAASIGFSSGLNVLHGPNDLGKSTLAEAIRAALLVPTKSSQGKSYVSWDTGAAARVVLTFEDGGKLWRVRKTFGSGYQSVLEQSESLDSHKFHEIAHGSGVEGTLRELLSWGIAPPGGKAQPTKPSSYLVTALLCRQGEAQSIFEASLAEDRDDTGKALVTNALGALAKEPLVARIVERLSERVETIFTPGEKFKKSADSPLVRLQEQLKAKDDRLRDLRDADSKGKAIEERVVTLQAERLQLLEQTQAAEATWSAAKEREARATVRANLQKVLDDCANSLALSDGLISELEVLQASLANGLVRLDGLKTEKSGAAAKAKATQELLQAAAEEVARASAAEAQSGQMAAAAAQQRRAELEGRKVSVEARLKDVASAERAVADRASLERDFHDWTAKAGRTSDQNLAAKRALEYAALTERLRELLDKQAKADRLLSAFESARSREMEGLGSLRAAEQALAAARARRDSSDSGTQPEEQQAQVELDLLRAVEIRLKTKSARDQVRDLEAHEDRATRCRDTAFANRSKASQIEQEVSGRVLPTKEQIASWRKLEVDLAQTPAPAVPAESSPLMPVAAGAGAGLVVALVLRSAIAPPALITILAAVTAAIVVGLSIWTVLRNKVRADAEGYESRRRLSERWALEVLPSLREARLPDLAAYEGALTDMERRRAEAQQLRLAAEKYDLQAAAAAQAAASLEARRAELAALERQTSPGGVAVDMAAVEASGGTLSSVRQRIDDGERQLEALKLHLRQGADDAVRDATEKLKEQRLAHDALLNEVASARAQSDVATEQCDPAGLAAVRQQIDALRTPDVVPLSVADATARLNRAKSEGAEASTRVAMLQTQLDAMRPEVTRLLSLVGDQPGVARQKAGAELAQIHEQLKELDSAPPQARLADAEVLANARQTRALLEKRLETDNQALDSATAALLEAEAAVAHVRTEIASKQGELKAIDRGGIESKRQAALEDPVLRVPDVDGIPLAAAVEAFEGLKGKLDECDGRLNAAKGQLHLVAGHVGAEQLAQQEEAVKYASDEVIEREQNEKAALYLLKAIQEAEAARTSHLGRTLAGPVTETFRALTGGRYGQLGLDPDLKTDGIAAVGASRDVSDLSVGTQEQLATLIRLAVAGHLKTALILDDQLVHSDEERLRWFREKLRASVVDHEHQVIVFTCRPSDYLPDGAVAGEGSSVSVLNLQAAVSSVTP
jgi:DNA repair exonuclease SbcCD ATPase subunit